MAKKKRRNSFEWLDSEGLMDMTGPGAEELSAGDVLELYKNLTDFEQDRMLKMIIDDGGLQRLASIAQDLDTPGAVDLMLDRVSFYHFFRAVRER